MTNRRSAVESLHCAALRGDSSLFEKLIAAIDPAVAEKVAAVLLRSDRTTGVSNTCGTPAARRAKSRKTSTSTPEVKKAQWKIDAKRKGATRLKRLLREQDSKRRTALYLACAAGNTDIADALLALGASTGFHGAWQRTPLHIASYQGHTQAVRRLLGAGADPWALNGRGQTPSEVSHMYNGNCQVQELLEEAANMRRAVSTGTSRQTRLLLSRMGGLKGATFVHDDGRTGIVLNAYEIWDFTLEVELDKRELETSSGAKLYLPVRGERPKIEKMPSSDSPISLAAVDVDTSTATDRCVPNLHTPPIPWSARVVQRIRLESTELVRVDGLVGARVSGTLLGGGTVTAVRDVSVRCEVETIAPGNGPDGAVLASSRNNATLVRRDDEVGLSVRERLLSMASTGAAHVLNLPFCNTADEDHGMEVAAAKCAACVGNGRPDEIRRTHLNGQCIAARAHGREEGGTGEAVGQTGEGYGEDRHVGNSSRLNGQAFNVTGTDAQTLRHVFSDNLVPLAAVKGVVDCENLPLSAAAPLSRARRRALVDRRKRRLSASPSSTPENRHQHDGLQNCLGKSPSSPFSPSQTPVMLELVEIVGMEGQIEREDQSEERRERKRARVEATRKAVFEALLLWSDKADILQAKLVAVRRVASSAASTVSESTTHDVTRAIPLDELLASPSPRCCACNTRGGSRQTPGTGNTTAPPLDCHSGTPNHAGSRKMALDIGGSTALRKAMVDRHAWSATSEYEEENLAAVFEDNLSSGQTNVDPSFLARSGPVGVSKDANATALSRDKQLVGRLEECLKNMMNLRDWLRYLDREIHRINAF
ncbi:unnamed protein product [Scytosiphon promiscuus]